MSKFRSLPDRGRWKVDLFGRRRRVSTRSDHRRQRAFAAHAWRYFAAAKQHRHLLRKRHHLPRRKNHVLDSDKCSCIGQLTHEAYRLSLFVKASIYGILLLTSYHEQYCA